MAHVTRRDVVNALLNTDWWWEYPDTHAAVKGLSESAIQACLLQEVVRELQRLNNTLSAVGCIHTTMKGLRRDIQKARRGHRRTV